MNAQADLPLPPVPKGRVLTLEELRGLIERGFAELEGEPALAPAIGSLQAAMPDCRLAALSALYAVASEEQRGLILTLRHLKKLLTEAEDHATGHTRRVSTVTVGRPDLAELLEAPEPIPLFPNQP